MKLAKALIKPTLLNHVAPPTLTLTISTLESRLIQCKTLAHLNQVLSQAILTGLLNDTFAASRILHFSTASPFVPARYSHSIFARVASPNGFIYNTMMRGGGPGRALGVYRLMLERREPPDGYTYPILIESCAVVGWEFGGRLVQCHVWKVGFGSDVYVKNNLISMYAACGDMGNAGKVFDETPVRDLVSWNSLLAGYVAVGDVEEARRVFGAMPESNVIASNSMIVLFGKKGSVEEARRLFDEMPQRDLVSWSALVSCYEQNGMYEDALHTFISMVRACVSVDEVVVVSALSACANLLSLVSGKWIHSLAVKIGICSYVNLQNALIHLYSTSGEMAAAEEVFNGAAWLNLFSWNSMISGYMKNLDVEKASDLFNSMPEKDLVSWSTMVSGYAQHGRYSDTMALFHEMQLHGIKPDESTLVSVISACTNLAAFDQGKWLDTYIRRNHVKINAILGATLVNMYMKFGCVQNALDVFSGLEEKGVSTWNALILGLAMNGMAEKSLDSFAEMKACGMPPNEITFMAVLGACRHMGLVYEGKSHFDSMIHEHKMEPNVKHYGCMVDLLGRAGRLEEAEQLIECMPMVPDVSTWGALLGACRKHGDIGMGERLGKKLLRLQPDHEGFNILLSNIYASKGNWDDVLEIRGMMMKHGVVKTPGCSMIEANGIVHEFLAGDKTHPKIKIIDDFLDEIARKLKVEGYSPNTLEVSLDIDEEEKETSLFRHSEKLAIAFGLMTISPPTPIRIMKNLRICNDCHRAAKLVSKVFDREIIVRDRHRFHHFKHGSCSCSDFW